MRNRLLGIETEYGLSPLIRKAGPAGLAESAESLVAEAMSQYSFLPGVSGGIFLGNGARFYVDPAEGRPRLRCRHTLLEASADFDDHAPSANTALRARSGPCAVCAKTPSRSSRKPCSAQCSTISPPRSRTARASSAR